MSPEGLAAARGMDDVDARSGAVDASILRWLGENPEEFFLLFSQEERRE